LTGRSEHPVRIFTAIILLQVMDLSLFSVQNNTQWTQQSNCKDVFTYVACVALETSLSWRPEAV